MIPYVQLREALSGEAESLAKQVFYGYYTTTQALCQVDKIEEFFFKGFGKISQFCVLTFYRSRGNIYLERGREVGLYRSEKKHSG